MRAVDAAVRSYTREAARTALPDALRRGGVVALIWLPVQIAMGETTATSLVRAAMAAMFYVAGWLGATAAILWWTHRGAA